MTTEVVSAEANIKAAIAALTQQKAFPADLRFAIARLQEALATLENQ